MMRYAGHVHPDKSMLRVVLDTNVIISGLFFKGPPARILDLVSAGEIMPVFSYGTFQELQQTLTHPKFQMPIARLPFTVADFFEELLSRSEMLEQQSIGFTIVSDPADNLFLACAVEGRVGYLVTGDKELLAVGHIMDIPITTPSIFLRDYAN